MKSSKIKSFVFGLAFLGTMGFVNTSFADDRGTQKDYYGEVQCPDGTIMPVRGKCCEPGGLFTCNYVTCSSYNPVSPTCPSIGG